MPFHIQPQLQMDEKEMRQLIIYLTKFPQIFPPVPESK